MPPLAAMPLAMLLLACGAVVSNAQAVVARDVIIIGAGAAGLGAARQLLDTMPSLNVTVLEARNRMGGRINTTFSTAKKYPIEWGAQWIHGGGSSNPLVALATAAGGYTTGKADSEVMYDSTGSAGRLVPWTSEEAGYEASYNAFYTWLDNQRYTDDLTWNLEDALTQYASQRGITGKALLGLRTCASSDIEQEYAGNFKRLSANYYDRDEDINTQPDLQLKQGYSKLIDNLRAPGGTKKVVDVRLNCEVASVDYTTSPIVVTLKNGTQYSAKFVVVTLPIGVLKATHAAMFKPALPGSKVTAINSLGVGVMNKVVLVYNSAWWATSPAKGNAEWITNLSNNSSRWTDFFSVQKTAARPVLVAFNVGDYAVELEAKNDNDTVKEALDTLRKMFPKTEVATIPQPVQAVVTRWSSDPFALGSYSFVAAGAARDVNSRLADPVSVGGVARLRFAGEATHAKYSATVHGALMSGQDQAKEILRLWPTYGAGRRLLRGE